jgi:hypothetical protein
MQSEKSLYGSARKVSLLRYIGIMTTSSISSASPLMSASVMQNLSRTPQTIPDARVSAAQENDVRRTTGAISGATPASINSVTSSSLNGPHANGPASIRTGLQIIPSPNDTEAALQSSASQIARLQSNPEQPTARAASEAYLTQAAARTRITQQGQGNGSQSVNVMA